MSGSLTIILNVLIVELNPKRSLACTVKINLRSIVVVPPSSVNLLLSIVERPSLVAVANCTTLPVISPSKFNFNPGGNLPLFNVYSNELSVTLVNAFTKNVLTKFALIAPRSASVVHLIVLSTSPKILTVNVFFFSAISS